VDLSLARAAVERRDAAALAQALARIGDWQRRLLADSPALPAQAGLLATLRALPLAAESPLAGSTLQQLRALRGQ
jgi:uroporphyrin-3 C-methyltransferase